VGAQAGLSLHESSLSSKEVTHNCWNALSKLSVQNAEYACQIMEGIVLYNVTLQVKLKLTAEAIKYTCDLRPQQVAPTTSVK